MKPFIALDSCITSNRTLIWLAIPSEISKSHSACQIYYFYNFSTIVTKSSILSYYLQNPWTYINFAHRHRQSDDKLGQMKIFRMLCNLSGSLCHKILLWHPFWLLNDKNHNWTQSRVSRYDDKSILKFSISYMPLN